jgi:hypothetical protein
VRIELRMVVEIVDPSGRSVYDSHRVDQDRRHDLDPGQTASGEFTWTIPADAALGTYEVKASLRHWNIWDEVFDYRWGDRPGPRFTILQKMQPFVIYVTIRPDGPTIDDLVEFTVIASSTQTDNKINTISLYVDNVLKQRWRGEGIFTYSERFSAGIHSYYLIVNDESGREFRFPSLGEFKFIVFIDDKVAGPPNLRISPLQVIVEFEGKYYKAFYSENIAVEVPIDLIQKDIREYYSRLYSRQNWYILDSNNKPVTDEDTYVKIAKAAQIAFISKDPEYLKERARFFKDIRDLGTLASLLKKIGSSLASLIPTVALGGVMPSSAGIARFGVIVKFTNLAKKFGEIADTELIITTIAGEMLSYAEKSLTEASKLAEPIYRMRVSNPVNPKIQVSYSTMMQLKDLLSAEMYGYAAIQILHYLHKEGFRGYLKAVIKAIIEGADPTGLATISGIIQNVPDLKEFFDVMAAKEAHQRIEEEAFEYGARSFAKLAREYARLMEERHLGGSVTVNNGRIALIEASRPDVKINGKIENGKLILYISSDDVKGATFNIDLDKSTILFNDVKDIVVIINGKKVKMADSLADILNPNDEEEPEYFILWYNKGVQIIISIPRFSTYVVEIMSRTITTDIYATAFQLHSIVPHSVYTDTVVSHAQSFNSALIIFIIMIILSIGLILGAFTISLKRVKRSNRRKPRVINVQQ